MFFWGHLYTQSTCNNCMILITYFRYDSIPEDLKCIEIKPLEGEDILDITQSSNRLTTHGTSVGSNPVRSNAILGALSRYIYNQRWIWKMSCQAKDLSTGAVAGVLYALTKYV